MVRERARGQSYRENCWRRNTAHHVTALLAEEQEWRPEERARSPVSFKTRVRRVYKLLRLAQLLFEMRDTSLRDKGASLCGFGTLLGLDQLVPHEKHPERGMPGCGVGGTV